MRKIGLILVAAIAIGMFALPATMAYFTGQHTFVYGNPLRAPPGSEYVLCTKCHADIGTEFTSGVHADAGMICNDCHVTTAMNGTSTYQNPSSKVGHASVAVECMDCHDGGVGPQVGNGSAHDITSSGAAHKDFFAAALANTDMNNGYNEACIACHTHTSVTISWAAGTNMSYDPASNSFAVV